MCCACACAYPAVAHLRALIHRDLPNDFWCEHNLLRVKCPPLFRRLLLPTTLHIPLIWPCERPRGGICRSGRKISACACGQPVRG